MTIQGVKVDTELKEQIKQELTKEIQEHVKLFNTKVQELLGMNVPINMNSPKDIGILVYDIMKLPNFHDKRRTDEESITRVMSLPQCTEQMRTILNTYLEYKKQMKFFSTYIETKIDEEGNVQLNIDTTADSTIAGDVATELIEFIEKSENDIQTAMEKVYEDFNEVYIKPLRRAIPVTGTKMNWNLNQVQMNNQ